MSPTPVLFGILVGGRSQRMGGLPKGNLDAGGLPLIVRTIELCREVARAHAMAGAERVALIGDGRAYIVDDVLRLDDAPAGVGPLGGLSALLEAALARGHDAVALAVDMPHLGAALLGRLIREHDGALALAPREAGRWQPLCARYRPARVLPLVRELLSRGQSSPQALFSALGSGAVELELEPAERVQLRDWDTPQDIEAFPVRSAPAQRR
jgi:molybdenum cofactor guanylyltransferase